MNRTSIEWCDVSVNPIRARNRATGSVGHFCEMVSPGCANCYARAWNSRVRPSPSGGVSIGLGLDYIPQNRDKVEVFLDESKLREVIRRKKPARIFWADMTDLFGEWVPDDLIDRCFGAMAQSSPQHTHQVLTKRADRMRAYSAGMAALSESERARRIVAAMYRGHPAEGLVSNASAGGGLPWPLPNVWLGVSAEDQVRADERVPLLLQTPASVRFVSYEPAIGPVSFNRGGWLRPTYTSCQQPDGHHLTELVKAAARRTGCVGLDWIIVGGESGPHARPFAVEWARSTVRQCRAASVACFVKQLGAHVIDRNDAGFDGDDPDRPTSWPSGIETDDWHLDPSRQYQGADARVLLGDRKGGSPDEWPKDLRVREFPGGGAS